MTLDELRELFIANDTNRLAWEGKCHDCGGDVKVKASVSIDTWKIDISGGSVYKHDNIFYLKCGYCHSRQPRLTDFQQCEVYSRVVGYLRPTSQWNNGKQQEFGDRLPFNMGG